MHLECNPVVQLNHVHVSPRQPSASPRSLNMMHCLVRSITHPSIMCTLISLPRALCQTNYLLQHISLTAKPRTWPLWTKKTDDVSDFGADFPVSPFSSLVIHSFHESETCWGRVIPECSFRTSVTPFRRLMSDWPFRTH